MPQTPDDLGAALLVRGGPHRCVDVENEAGEIVVPIEAPEPAEAMRAGLSLSIAMALPGSSSNSWSSSGMTIAPGDINSDSRAAMASMAPCSPWTRNSFPSIGRWRRTQ